MNTTMKTETGSGLRVKSNTKAGGMKINHNQEPSGLKVKSNVKAGGIQFNHNQAASGLKVKSKVKAGGSCDDFLCTGNHNQNLL